ncbi:uncharacterized protein BDW70DRAFT_163509 [Aspergillus foveolatus]|uniref:uncharacterized protein n=1 Tax=Aspergillus foveolatus TaxID=210207 RepID=UPI003CCDB88A
MRYIGVNLSKSSSELDYDSEHPRKDGIKSMEVAVSTHVPDEWKNEKVAKADRNVAWYQAALSKVPDIAREIFLDYSDIPEDKITAHVHQVRDRAWDILPFPCIGLFRFLGFPAYLQPVYPRDIRKLVHDGASGENLIGVDTPKAHFLTGDALAEDFLAEWRGKIDIIFLGSFLHLFSFEQQKAIVAR